MARSYFRSHHRVLIGTQSVLALTLLSLTVARFGSSAFADPGSDWDFRSSPPTTTLTSVDLNGGGNGDGGLALFRANKDNTRNRWVWTEDAGWVLMTDEQTYENGWAWYWKNGQWSWERLNTDAPGSLKGVAPTLPASSTAITTIDAAGCFDDAGSWVTDRSQCAVDQAGKRMNAFAEIRADDASILIPEDIREVLEIAVPLTPAEETQVKAVLIERFEGAPAVAVAEDVVENAATDVVRKLSILKSSDALTDKEREYFVSKIVEAQAFLGADAQISTMDMADATADKLADLVSEVQSYVQEHAISLHVENAPTANTIFTSSKRILAALPAAFDTLDAAGFTTSNLRSMHRATSVLADSVSVRCKTQNKDCSRVSDVVYQLEKIMSTLHEMLNASGNGGLKEQVMSNFDAALRHE